ncbi:hypothetical protein FBU30_010112 [Linnemannia zychae]|nr:hypothetical protein FBU30_010112 [Linnemannia zychae]
MSDFIAQEDHWFTTVKSLADKTPEKFFDAFGIADKSKAIVDTGTLSNDFQHELGAQQSGLLDHWLELQSLLPETPFVVAQMCPKHLYMMPSITLTGRPAHRYQSRPLSLEDLEPPPPPPPHTEQPGPLRLEDLGQPPPPDTSRTHDVSSESLLIGQDGKEVLLSHIESIGHECEPRQDEGCLACLFKTYQRSCVIVFHQSELRITDVAVVAAILGVLVPFRPTERMKSVFKGKTLGVLRKSDQEWPDVGFDENLVTSAIRHCLHGQRERVGQVLLPLEEGHRRIRLLLETRLEYLPLEEAKGLSEMDFIP